MSKLEKNFIYQGKFNDYLKSIIPENALLAEIISQVIDSSADAAYRRIRMQTAYTLDEMIKICVHFNIDPK